MTFTKAKKLENTAKITTPYKEEKEEECGPTLPYASIPHRLLKGIINNAKPDCSHGLKPKSKLTPHMPLPCLTIAHAHGHCPLSLTT